MELLVEGEEEEDESRRCATSARGFKCCVPRPASARSSSTVAGREAGGSGIPESGGGSMVAVWRDVGADMLGMYPDSTNKAALLGRQLQRPFQNVIREKGAISIFTRLQIYIYNIDSGGSCLGGELDST